MAVKQGAQPSKVQISRLAHTHAPPLGLPSVNTCNFYFCQRTHERIASMFCHARSGSIPSDPPGPPAHPHPSPPIPSHPQPSPAIPVRAGSEVRRGRWGRRSRWRTCAACLLELLVVAKVRRGRTCGGCGGQATLQLGQELDRRHGVLEAARLNWVDHGILGQLRLQPRLDALREEGERRIVRLACARG